jgi:hypothetical protein
MTTREQPKYPYTPVKDVAQVSDKTDRAEKLWLRGQPQPLHVHRIPTKHLFFNIENGRYADRMLQLRADYPSENIDARDPVWRTQILHMLRGTYKGSKTTEGTHPDKAPFEKLKEDVKARTQLKPGIVTTDGGVLDGNRRLAALLTLASEEKTNPTEYEYFEGVILPFNTTAEDRWAIEAGRQLGKDEPLDYPPICELLKIRQGLAIFGSSKGVQSNTPYERVAQVLGFGTTAVMVRDMAERLQLIDEYLTFFGIPCQYHQVAGLNERFIEFQKNLKTAALRLSPAGFAQLKVLHFLLIKGQIMTNWELRKINIALGGTRSKKPMTDTLVPLLNSVPAPEKAKNAVANGTVDEVVDGLADAAETFIGEVEDGERSNKPIMLIKGVHSRLKTISDALAKRPLPTECREEFQDFVAKCDKLIHDVRVAATKAGGR